MRGRGTWIQSHVFFEAAQEAVADPGRELADVTPLAGMSSLFTLDLNGNQISDVTPLADLNPPNTSRMVSFTGPRYGTSTVLPSEAL